jgi:flavin-dependent dehydrogenase
MLIFTSALASGSVIDADVCLIGGGPAALTIAQALDGTPLRVELLEAGGPPGSPSGLSTDRVSADDTDFAAPGQAPQRFGGAAKSGSSACRG